MTINGQFLIKLLVIHFFDVFLLIHSVRHDNSPQPLRVVSNRFPHAAVVSDNHICSSMGNGILKRNGSAVDVAMAVLLCLGVVGLPFVGIGGGGHMTIYTRSTGKTEVIDFKECAPSGIKDEDYKKPWKIGQYYVDPKLERGGKSIGVPGLLKGLQLAHQRHGVLQWKDIFESAAKLAESEHELNKHFVDDLETDLKLYKKTEFEDFRSFMATVKKRKKRAFATNPALAETYRTLGKAGSAAPFYDGVLSKTIIEDMRRNQGTMTLEDLKNYRAILREPVKINLDDNTMYSTPPPAGGMILSLMLNTLKGYHFSKIDNDDNMEKISSVYHKIIESQKWSFANTGWLGDPQFPSTTDTTSFFLHQPNCKKNISCLDQGIKELLTDEHGTLIRHAISDTRTYNVSHYNPDTLIGKLQGTTQISILAPNGDAVAVTASLNDPFGSYVFSKKLGILFNNQLKDFREYGQIAQSIGQKTALNVIVPGKRVPSLMSPSIIVDKNNDVVMVIGAAGGSRIPTSVTQVIARHMWLGMDLATAMNTPRFHHQLFPNTVFVQESLPRKIRKTLRAFGHEISEDIPLVAHFPTKDIGRVNALVVERTKHSNKISIHAVSDGKPGGPDGY